MDLTPLIPEGRQLVQSYYPGGFRITGERFAGSIIVFPERTLAWSVSDKGELDAEAFAPVIAAEPAVNFLLLGCGARGIRVAPELREALRAGGIGVEAMDTGAACRTYNVMMAEERRVAAALIALGE